MKPVGQAVLDDGWSVTQPVLAVDAVDRLTRELAPVLGVNDGRGGVRNLLELPGFRLVIVLAQRDAP